MTTETLIRLQSVSKRWGASRGVERLDIDIPRGAFVALLGPSGCGKSTTLRIVAGLETPDEGRVFIGGVDRTTAPPGARGLSMVFQSYALFPHLDVGENIVFGLKVRRVRKAEREERLRRALELTGLTGLERRRPAQLSGGQRQRVALARAVVADHAICLMDEPLSNLDAKLRHSVRQEIRALQRRLGMTVLYVTHDQTEAMAMADRVVLMKDGRIEQMGEPAELYRHPSTSFAASFIGSPPMSLVAADALRSLRARPELPTGALAGLRPENVRLVAPEEGLLVGTVSDVEFLGAETFVGVTIDGGGRLSARVSGEARVAPADPVGLAWEEGDLHLFAPEGQRLPDIRNRARQGAAGTMASPRGSNERITTNRGYL